VTSLEPKTLFSADRDIPDTEVIVVPAPAPVFVDSTGRRRTLLRRLAYAFGGLCMLYGGLVSVSLAGGPVSSSAVLPLPDLHSSDDDDAVDARPSPTPAPTITGAPQPLLITEALPRRAAPATREVGVRSLEVARTPTPSASPTLSKTPPPSASTTTKPVESTTKPSQSGSPSPSTSTSTTAPNPGTVPPGNNPPAPGPPSVPSNPSQGGSGGGSSTGGSSGSGSSGTDDPVAAPTQAPAGDDPADAPAEDPAAADGTAVIDAVAGGAA
jgi:hypothetical protein